MLLRLILISLFPLMAAFSQIPPIEPGVSHELAKWRAVHYSDVRYKLNLTLEKMSPVLRGSMEIHVTQAATACAEPDCPPMYIVLDWRKIKGHEDKSTVSNVVINGKPLLPALAANSVAGDFDPTFEERDEHLIFHDGVKMGENVIKLDFTSPILASGSAVTRYIDKEDGAEYIYSLFVPSDASTAFPVFDQPDLKARFTLGITTPQDWTAVSNEATQGSLDSRQCTTLPTPSGSFNLISPEPVGKNIREKTAADRTDIGNRSSNPCPINAFGFPETKPISTYVFAFAAGPLVKFPAKDVYSSWNEDDVTHFLVSKSGNPTGSETSAKLNTAPTSKALPTGRVTALAADVSTSIFVRKSQAEKFKPHAAEIFRLNREGISFLESYFDYKFPFPKYDIVLIPEFPFGGMEHAGATFLREDRVIFPQEPTKNDYITRANVIFHEAAHQWFGDTVTMKWFDDLWLKEGFAEFMAYKTLEKVMPEYNAWKVFYERNKQAAYLTDSTKGTTPIYQQIDNLSAAKSAYGNIVYRKAPSFLRQAEFYLGEDKFQTAVRAFLKKHEYANAGWEDLVAEFEAASGQKLNEWAAAWVMRPGLGLFRLSSRQGSGGCFGYSISVSGRVGYELPWKTKISYLIRTMSGRQLYGKPAFSNEFGEMICDADDKGFAFIFPNYQDYGYGIFLLDDKSRDYVLKNIGREKDDFLRTMMWGSLWDSVREAELDPKEYVELVIKNLGSTGPKPARSKGVKQPPAKPDDSLPETDESTIQTLLGRVSTAMRYYLSDSNAMQKPERKQGLNIQRSTQALPNGQASASDLQTRLEALLIDQMQNAPTPGLRITYYRAFLSLGSSPNARRIMKIILNGGNVGKRGTITTKDRFDIVERLIALGDPEAPKLLATLEKTETTDEAKRYAYAAKAGFATAKNKAKYWNDFVNNKEISESWIEAAFGQFNSIKHSELTLPYLEKSLAELPNLKQNRKIFFVNGWLGAFIGGQRSSQALAIVNKFLADNPNLDKDLRLKILENADVIERAVKIRAKF